MPDAAEEQHHEPKNEDQLLRWVLERSHTDLTAELEISQSAVSQLERGDDDEVEISITQTRTAKISGRLFSRNCASG